nr:hypothetical protein [Rickettsia endosymbiont of Ceutorhynchus assimilis]
MRGGIYADAAIKYKHIFILNLFSILIKSLITFGIAWIAAATSWLRNDEFFINFRAMQQCPKAGIQKNYSHPEFISGSLCNGFVAWLPESSLRGGIYADAAIKYKHIFILNLFSILIKSLITFGIAWIAAATSWLRNDEFFINFRATQQRRNKFRMTEKCFFLDCRVGTTSLLAMTIPGATQQRLQSLAMTIPGAMRALPPRNGVIKLHQIADIF